MPIDLSKPVKTRLIICSNEADAEAIKASGPKSVRVVRSVEEIYRFDGQMQDYAVDSTIDYFTEIVLALPRGAEMFRDDLALRLGDVRCRWVEWPDKTGSAAQIKNDPKFLADLIETARPMWTEEVARMGDVPDAGPVQRFETGFELLDRHGMRFVLPAFMPIIGPYGSGKSIFLRQLLINLWRLHGWKFLLTSFEEPIKPRYQRDFRRHLIGAVEETWTPHEIASADAEMNEACVFLRRKKGMMLDAERLITLIEYSVKVYGIRVVAIDPVNEIDHRVPPGMSKTDYIGQFIIRLKQLADDYKLLMICVVHPPKDGVEKRLQKDRYLTLNDGADSAHWGNKADIGLCVWRSNAGPTYLHVDKLKDHETMGRPTLCELLYNSALNSFRIGRMGYHILENGE